MILSTLANNENFKHSLKGSLPLFLHQKNQLFVKFLIFFNLLGYLIPGLISKPCKKIDLI